MAYLSSSEVRDLSRLSSSLALGKGQEAPPLQGPRVGALGGEHRAGTGAPCGRTGGCRLRHRRGGPPPGEPCEAWCRLGARCCCLRRRSGQRSLERTPSPGAGSAVSRSARDCAVPPGVWPCWAHCLRSPGSRTAQCDPHPPPPGAGSAAQGPAKQRRSLRLWAQTLPRQLPSLGPHRRSLPPTLSPARDSRPCL